MLRTSTLAGLLVVSVSSYAAGDELVEKAINEAVRSRQTSEVANNMRSVTAYYIDQDAQGCAQVSVQSTAQRRLRHFRSCIDSIDERYDVEPAAPASDLNYRKLLVSTGRSALSTGDARANFDGYAINARRVGWPMMNGCGYVRVVVSYDGMLVETDQPTVCP